MASTPHVVVIGGGATGTAIARDLAMRGLAVTLCERTGLASGATGRMHGMLHSGARYADTDPESARACIQENEVLRHIAGQFVTDTGGLFVEHPSDPQAYIDEKQTACEACAIPVERIDGERARQREPGLTEEITQALTVPDGVVDPCGVVAATALSAKRHSATIETGVRVTGVTRTDNTVDGVTISREGGAGRTTLDADYVINAAGAWADTVARAAGIDLSVRQSQGALAVVDTDAVDSIVNRCRPRTAGDIAVPYGDTTLLGATDVEIDSADDVDPSQEEISLLVDELAPVVPAVETAEILSTYWGVRPLFAPEDGATSTGDVTRGFSVLDHESKDNLAGLTTVIGGKFTTHRLMAENVTDHVCEKFGIDSQCRTHETPLPGNGDDPLPEGTLDRYAVDSPMRGLSDAG